MGHIMTGDKIRKELESGLCSLGIEFGSTRIKAILISSDKSPVASGAYDWENRLEDGIWTYSIDDILTGLKGCYHELKKDVLSKYGVRLANLKAIGISAMMHGYMPFDADGNLLSPFRTWRNNITEKESEELTELFSYPIPQRWTISHLFKDMKEQKAYLTVLDHVSTLACYVHTILTGKHVIGIGDASGMFPIDTETKDYLESALSVFNEKFVIGKYEWTIKDVLPEVLVAGNEAGCLTKEGALLLDEEGDLKEGIPFCPPEGDAETGMMATNAVRARSGNVSAGTSVFASIVLEKPLKKAYSQLDIVTTPDGRQVAMAHSNNCTGSYDMWIRMFDEVLKALGVHVSKGELYDRLLSLALEADPAAGGLVSYPYLSGEHITGFSSGCLMHLIPDDAELSISSFMRSELFASLSAMRIGLDILFEKEGVTIDMISGHGGFFKTPSVGQTIMAAVTKTPCRVLSTAGEGGAWGIALLADYLSSDKSLERYLDEDVFRNAESSVVYPRKEDMEGYEKYLERYKKGLCVERKAVETFSEEGQYV